MAFERGRALGHYVIQELLGVGGMGEVYAADDTRLKRRLAIKVLPDAGGHDETRRIRFEREAQSVAALNHPNIVTLSLGRTRRRHDVLDDGARGRAAAD